jgi:hypothetical protein
MHKRFLAITVLTAAVLFSQGGHLLVAALCPHLRAGMASCETPPAKASMSHEDMGHGGHKEMEPEPATQPDSNGSALGQPIDACSHCAVHSRNTPNAVSLRATEVAKRSLDFNIPLSVSGVAPAIVSPVAVLTSRAHGPPGEHTPRYILINIFRI